MVTSSVTGMKRGTDDYLREHPIDPQQLDSDTRTTRSTKDSEIREMRRRLTKRQSFLRTLARCRVTDRRRVAELERLSGMVVSDETQAA